MVVDWVQFCLIIKKKKRNFQNLGCCDQRRQKSPDSPVEGGCSLAGGLVCEQGFSRKCRGRGWGWGEGCERGVLIVTRCRMLLAFSTPNAAWLNLQQRTEPSRKNWPLRKTFPIRNASSSPAEKWR